MKKKLFVLCLAALLITTSCASSKVKLEEGESHIILTEDEFAIRLALDEDDADDFMDLDIDDDDEDILDDMEDYIDDDPILDEDDVKASVISNKKELLIIELRTDEEDSMISGGFLKQLENPVGKIVVQRYDDDLDDFMDEYELLDFKSGEDLSDEDYEQVYEYCYLEIIEDYYEDDYYVTLPFGIFAVDEDLEYEYVDEFTIKLEDDSEGMVIFNNPEFEFDPEDYEIEVDLDVNEMHLMINSDESAMFEFLFDEYTLDDLFYMDEEDDLSDIEEALEEMWFEYMDGSIVVTKEGDNYRMMFTTDDAEYLVDDLFYDEYLIKLEDYLYESDEYDYWDLFYYYEDFVIAESGDFFDASGFIDYEDYYIHEVQGGLEGIYYTFPSEIMFISCYDYDFDEDHNNMIYIPEGEYGYVIIKPFK